MPGESEFTIYVESSLQPALLYLHTSFAHLQGIALINGTQMITALGVEALHRAELIAKQADIVAALSIDVLQGTPRAFEAGITRLLWQRVLSEHCAPFCQTEPYCILAPLC